MKTLGTEVGSGGGAGAATLLPTHPRVGQGREEATAATAGQRRMWWTAVPKVRVIKYFSLYSVYIQSIFSLYSV